MATLCVRVEDVNATTASSTGSTPCATTSRLRVAGQATERFREEAIATGDGLAGVTGVARSLKWPTRAVGIAEKFDHFKDTYDRKYDGMMRA